MMRWLHGVRLAFFGDPAGFMDGLIEPFRTLGLWELTAATWIAARLAARPHWRAVTGSGLAAAFDAGGDMLAAAQAPGVLRLAGDPARIATSGAVTLEAWDPWAVYGAARRAGGSRTDALKAAWPQTGARYLPGGAALYGPATGAAAERSSEEGWVDGADEHLARAFADPAVRMVYTDEVGPAVFKTAFDAVRLETQDYIGEAFAVRPGLAVDGTGAREIAAAMPPGSIRHIPCPCGVARSRPPGRPRRAPPWVRLLQCG